MRRSRSTGIREAEPPKRIRSGDFAAAGQSNSANRPGRTKSMLPQPSSSTRSGTVSRLTVGSKVGGKRSSSSGPGVGGGPMVERNRNSSSTPSNGGRASSQGVRNRSAERLAVRTNQSDFTTPQRLAPPARKSVVQSDRRLTNTGRLSGRGSQVGAKGAKDTRPLSDKQYQQTQVRKILDFLREASYPNTNLTSKHFPLSTKEFVLVFNFLYSFINPKSENVLPASRFEDEIIKLLKELNYPGNLTRSNFLTMGSLHSYPSVLGSLSFMCDLASMFTSKLMPNIIAIGFPNRDEMGFSMDRETKEKIHFEHHLRCNMEFNEGSDTFSEALNDLHENLIENQGVDLDQLMQMQQQATGLEVEVERLSQKETQKTGLLEKKQIIQSDVDKMSDYLEKVSRHIGEKETEVATRDQTGKELGDKIQAMEEKVTELKENCEQRKVSSYEVERNKGLIAEKRRQVETVRHDVEEVEKEVWEKEINASRGREGLNNLVKQVNSLSLEEGLTNTSGEHINLSMARFNGEQIAKNSIDQMGGDLRMELGELLRSTRAETRLKERDQQDEMTGVEQVKETLKLKKKELNDRDIEHRRLQEEINLCKTKIEKEDSCYDQELSSIREEILRLKSTERVNMDDVARELERSQVRLQEAQLEREQHRKEGEEFLRKVADRTLTYIEENNGYRDRAVETVKQLAVTRVEEVRAAAKEVEQRVEQEIRKVNQRKM